MPVVEHTEAGDALLMSIENLQYCVNCGFVAYFLEKEFCMKRCPFCDAFMINKDQKVKQRLQCQ